MYLPKIKNSFVKITWFFLVLAICFASYSVLSSQVHAQTTCNPCSLWSNTNTPQVASWGDSNSVELGVKFRANTNGQITGIKFYKGSTNTGTHVGSLWSSSGQRLAQATFVNETASGWQQVTFATPVIITANTTYIASYFAPVGRYSVTRSYFTSSYTNGPLTALQNGFDGGNGVYNYSATSTFPSLTYQSTNYWVDVVFVPNTGPTPTPTLTPTPGPTSTPTPTPTIGPTPTATPTPLPTPTPGPCTQNAIVCENQKPGNPISEWDVLTPNTNIEGYATDMSVNKGQAIQFKVNTNSNNYRIDIYRMGYYGGMGARKITTINPSVALPQTQPSCLFISTTGTTDCGNWAVSASWNVPADAVSGIYIGKLVRQDATSGSGHIFFVVRDDTGSSDILFKTSDSTWQAYNNYGGKTLYDSRSTNGQRAYKVSYNRPFTESEVLVWEYPMIRWLESNGYNVSYASTIDADRSGAEILEHRVYLSIGHDEYWSGGQRANVEAARNAGVNIAFFSGNEIFWKTRWENSLDGNNTPYRTLVCYKETHANAKIDPVPNVWTGTWRDPRFSPPADGGRPENALSGTLFMVNGPRNDAITVPYGYSRMRLWRNTSVASLTPGQVASFPNGSLGYEWDESPDNNFAPAGLVKFSSTTVNVSPNYLQDYGSTYGNGTATHNLTLYRYSNNALVFSAGTVNWMKGLETDYQGAGSPDIRMRQATVNLFADMGVQPGSLRPGLVPASATTDVSVPTSVITSPANGSTIQTATTVNVTGTASDIGGGVVGGVEVSTDNGVTWHQATGRENWSYTWTPMVAGTYTIRSKAVDDSGRLETPASGVTVTIGSTIVNCPCSIWNSSTVPTNTSWNDSNAVELGVKFRSNISGTISSIKFYKGNGNTGTHTGSLWNSNGTLLATATFINETASGWQTVNFTTPVAITANTTYVASYHTNTGHYALDRPYFIIARTNGPLTALADGTDGGNGVYLYGAGGFPVNTSGSANYWVDVVFNASSGPTPTPTPSGNPTPTPTPIPTPLPTPTQTPTPTPTPIPPFPGGETATLGNNTIGSTGDTFNNNYMTGSRFTTGTSGGNVSSMSVYVNNVGAAPNNQYQLAIYTDSNGSPGTLVASSTIGTLTSNSWNTQAVTSNLSANTTYWLMYNSNGTSGSSNGLRYNFTGLGGWRSQTFGSWPQTFGSATVRSGQEYSIYATYTTVP